MVQVLALEQDPRAAGLAAQPFCVVDRTGPADVVRQVGLEFGDEGGIDARGIVGGGQFVERTDQGLGDEAPAVTAEVARGVGLTKVVDGRGGGGIDRGVGHAGSSGSVRSRSGGGQVALRCRTRHLTIAAGTRRQRLWRYVPGCG